MFALQCRRSIAASQPFSFSQARRALSTLPNNSHIYVHSNSPSSHTLSYLQTCPPNPSLAIGVTTTVPPTPDSLKENHKFLDILQSVIRENATQDPDVIAAARMYASSAGSSLGSGGVFFPQNHPSRAGSRRKVKTYGGGGGAGGDGAGGASAQGGMGGAGRGGWVHVSDQRHPPDFGRIADPEDIFGSLEVDGEGNFVGEKGGYQTSGTYRVVTRDGILGLSPYLREKLVERLKQMETESKR
ncbi:hypothetical protein M8818_004140 [Zalaria obscura]|uniref:Uncharacterized protein n=1 Tax=Zalaria obscura TaxID=2024903 RepID=A0ACC3SCE4_9PEZI